MTLADMLREQGRKEGELDGWRKILVLQLRVRFGDLAEGVVERIRAAGREQLESWTERVLTARTLDEVLG